LDMAVVHRELAEQSARENAEPSTEQQVASSDK